MRELPTFFGEPVDEGLRRLILRDHLLRRRLNEWKSLGKGLLSHPELDYDDGLPAPLVIYTNGDLLELQWDLSRDDGVVEYAPALPDGCYTPLVEEWLRYGVELAGGSLSGPAAHVPWILPLPNEMRLMLIPPPPNPRRGVAPEACEEFAEFCGFSSFAEMWGQTIVLQGPGYLQRWATALPTGDDWLLWDVPDLRRFSCLMFSRSLADLRQQMVNEAFAYCLGFASEQGLSRASEPAYRDSNGTVYYVTRLPFYAGDWAVWGAGASSVSEVRFFETRDAAFAYLARVLDSPEAVDPREFQIGFPA